MAKIKIAAFEEGDLVKKGQTLVLLDTRDIKVQRRQAKAAQTAAATADRLAQGNLERMERLFESGSVTRAQLDQATAARAETSAARASAEAAIAQAQVGLSYSKIVAPFDARVVRRLVEQGDLLSPGQPVAVLEDTTRLRVIAPVSPRAAGFLSAGNEVQLEIGSQPAVGRVEGILSSGDTRAPGTRLQLVVDNDHKRFSAGDWVRISLPVDGDSSPAAWVPQAALAHRGSMLGVFVVDEDERARMRWVIPGDRSANATEILTGLRVGEDVAIPLDADCLQDGRKVSVKHRG